ncbi:MAG TPA: cobalamin-binding protein [Dictyoglomaceae bacterium]|nr:cobalamin-binding protein [Dictyoglomaceae bacterium]HOP94312.1 cobalamin-binding protein [Dictyoglomaceae bacterium]HPP15232.1 cobalamin-binding protein [Dictyoglomaceae bacterium]HPU42639.1 cobalamin-binding protein [Dictyoglomaceae bacterium]
MPKKELKNIYILVFVLLFIISFSFAFPITVKDDMGRSITINTPPTRIISLAPSATEILFAINAQEKIVGVTDYCNFPKEAQRKEKVGGFSNPNIEKIISLNPDLIILYESFPKEIFNQLEKSLPQTNFLVLDPKNFEDVLENILLVGKVIGKEKEARAVHNDMLRRWGNIQKKALQVKKLPKVLFLLWNDPFTSASPNTFLGDLLRKVRAKNIVEKNEPEYPVLSVEYILEKNPDVILIGETSGISKESILNHPMLKQTNAVKNKMVYTINDDLVFRPGPRLIEGMERLFELLYPEIPL